MTLQNNEDYRDVVTFSTQKISWLYFEFLVCSGSMTNFKKPHLEMNLKITLSTKVSIMLDTFLFLVSNNSDLGWIHPISHNHYVNCIRRLLTVFVGMNWGETTCLNKPLKSSMIRWPNMAPFSSRFCVGCIFSLPMLQRFIFHC